MVGLRLKVHLRRFYEEVGRPVSRYCLSDRLGRFCEPFLSQKRFNNSDLRS